MAKRIDPATLPVITGTTYPSPYDEPCRNRHRTRLGDAAGVTQYGVNLLRLESGAWSSQRHWHTGGDEFIYVVSGEVVLVSDAGDEVLRAGDCAGFKAGDPDGHHLQNRSGADATILEIGSRVPGEAAYYPGIDLVAQGASPAKPGGYTHTDGTPYPPANRR
ncbi:MAG TPA: cupin domain-containing protein [Stellaceae bacterium]|nr:cupin domain-containing protein [Stellaceae bacterium]